MSNNFLSDTESNMYVKEFLDKFLLKYGKINYAAAILDKRDFNNIVIISSMSDYFDNIYFKKKYQHIDPIIINSLNRVSPFIWDNTLMVNNVWSLDEILDSIESHCNVVSGQTFVLHCPDNKMALMSLYVNKYLMLEVNADITRDKDELQGILISVYEMFVHLYHKKEGKSKPAPELTFREKEILHWASLGKTYPEIAVITGISVRTVKFHMSNVTRKLGVNNTKHAIRLSVELNLIADIRNK